MADVDIVEVTISAERASAIGLDPSGRRVAFDTSPHHLIKVAELLAQGRPSVRIRVGADGIHPVELAPARS